MRVGGDQITPAMAINKEIDLRFVFAYSPPEFRQTLHMLADGRIDPRPLITGTVGLDAKWRVRSTRSPPTAA